MRDTREILRQKWLLGRSHREAARSVGVSPGAVGEALRRAKAAGLGSWSEVEALAPSELEARLYPASVATAERPMPDCAWIHRERRRAGVTLELLHLEYLERHPDGYRYTQFCERYREWLARRGMTMRQVHYAGDKAFVDYSGKKPCIFDPKTGEAIEVELFVAVLGASNFTFAEATRTQQGRDWIGSHIRAFGHFGGVTAATVCDQLKSGVVVPCRYEPGVQRTYEEFAEHYGTSILPARGGHPRDKAKVEVGVQLAQRWLIARMRNETHFSLESFNARLAELLEEFNDRPMRVYGASRREMFERLDRPALKPLPSSAFVYGEWKTAKVNVDYHVDVGHHYYSVPHQYLGEYLDTRASALTVEIFRDGKRIASHARSAERGRHTTITAHMPVAHRAHLEWSPSRIIRWAGTIGPSTRVLVDAILNDRPHPEQGYRSCLGILRLEKRYGATRLEAACARAFAARARSYRSVESILRHGLDRAPAPSDHDEPATKSSSHDNVRGPNYYN